jgi:uncharacterized protein CbrC (UPF0167 family)
MYEPIIFAGETRQGFCDCCDTYRPLSFSTSYATGDTMACAVCSGDEAAYHRFARFGMGFVDTRAYLKWPPILAVYARVAAEVANSLP